MRLSSERLNCPWCQWHVLTVGAKGTAAVVSARHIAWRHVEERHGKTWEEFAEALDDEDDQGVGGGDS